jgi:hypothetical protein
LKWNREVEVGDYIFAFSKAPGRITCISGTIEAIGIDEELVIKTSNDTLHLHPNNFDIMSRTEPTKWS